jgi:hypothetical protein
MSKRSFVARHGYGHVRGQIFLGRALFCVGCEIIFTGSPHCPRCTSDETVWPLSEWFGSVRASTVAAPPSPSSVDASLPTRQQQKRPAA